MLDTVHGPRLRLLIIGGGQLSRYLAAMAVMLDYRVTVCDPREEYHEGWQAMEGVTLSRADARRPGAGDERSTPTARVVAVTHDPKLDDLALMEALKHARLLRRRARLAAQQRSAARAAAAVRRQPRRIGARCAARWACAWAA